MKYFYIGFIIGSCIGWLITKLINIYTYTERREWEEFMNKLP